jgi:diguanylate cyclase (GGDEF)-like protein
VLTRTGLDDAVAIAERVRQLIAATPVRFEGRAIPVTVSIGVSCDDGESLDESADLLNLADEQLYLAKKSGRNQVRSPLRNPV